MLIVFLSLRKTALRNKTKLAAIKKDNHEEHPSDNQAGDTNVSRFREDFIIQVSAETEDRLTKKLSQEFSRKKSRIFGALSKLYEFLLKPEARVHYRPIPETIFISNVEIQGTKEDRSQNDPHAEVGASPSHSSQEFSPD